MTKIVVPQQEIDSFMEHDANVNIEVTSFSWEDGYGKPSAEFEVNVIRDLEFESDEYALKEDLEFAENELERYDIQLLQQNQLIMESMEGTEDFGKLIHIVSNADNVLESNMLLVGALIAQNKALNDFIANSQPLAEVGVPVMDGFLSSFFARIGL